MTTVESWTESGGCYARLQDENLDLQTREDLEDDLEKYTIAVETTEDNKWLITPEQLQGYQSMTDFLYFAPMNVFEKSVDGFDTLHSLYDRFSYGQLTATQMLQELDRVATMMQLED